MNTPQRNYKKHPHTARFLMAFHRGSGQDLPTEITEDGRKLDSDGNPWVPAEERAAMDFLNSDAPAEEYVAPEPVKAAPAHKRQAAGYLAEFQGHQVRCGDGFITEDQAKWIVDILVKREVSGAEQTFIRLEQGLAKYAGSQFITSNKNAPLKPQAPKVTAAMAEAIAPGASMEELEEDRLPAGRYALRTEDGGVRFYQYDKPTEGRWAGWKFLKVQASDDVYPIKNRIEKARIISAILEDVEGALRLYGQELGKCGMCGRTLTNDESRAYGIGPECRKK